MPDALEQLATRQTPTVTAPEGRMSPREAVAELVRRGPAPQPRAQGVQVVVTSPNLRRLYEQRGFYVDRQGRVFRGDMPVLVEPQTELERLGRLFSASALPVAGIATSPFRNILRFAHRSSVPATTAIAPAREAAGDALDALAGRIAQMSRADGGVLLPKPAAQVAPAPTRTVPQPLAQGVLREPIHRRITVAAGELFARAGMPRDPNLRVSDQITQLLETERLPVNELQATLQRYNLSITEFANEVFRPSIKDAARRLQALSALQQRLNRLMQSAPQDAQRLRELAGEVDVMVRAKSLWQAPVNIWRALLVSQPATAARNFVTQVGRLGMDALEQGINRGLQIATGKPRTANPLEPLRAISNIFFRAPRKQAAQTTELLLRQMPAEWDRMFGRFMGDVASGARRGAVALRGVDKVIQKAEDGVAMVGGLNRANEFLHRRAIFEATLWQRLRNRGLDLYDVIRQNRIDAVLEDDIRFAVEKSLEITFGRQPQFGTAGYHFVRLVNKSGPILAPAIPFPRFMVESLRFYYEFSPLGALRLLNPAERAAVAAGNFSVISRAALGTAMLGAAYQLRKSEHAGERWYEVRVGGKTIDLRPFNPFSPYLFIADLYHRKNIGTLYRLDAKDLLTGLAGVNFRAGTGLFILDQVIDQFTGEGKAQKALDFLKTTAGQFASGFLMPLQVVSDVLAEFDESLKIIRETRTEPLLDPIKARIPGLAQTLPEAESPTREGPMIREQTALRQATGISVRQEKNPAEAEFDRLQFSRGEILPSTGNPEADRLLAKHMGVLVERAIVPIVRSPGYKGLSDAAKGEFLRMQLGALRQAARALAEAENPQLFAKLKFERRPIRQRRLIEELVPRQ